MANALRDWQERKSSREAEHRERHAAWRRRQEARVKRERPKAAAPRAASAAPRPAAASAEVASSRPWPDVSQLELLVSQIAHAIGLVAAEERQLAERTHLLESVVGELESFV